MEYFKAFSIPEKPYITWSMWAKDEAELLEKGLADDPLILGRDLIPASIYGVCPLKIVGGELVERTSLEMDDFEAEYELSTNLLQQEQFGRNIRTKTFIYDGVEFPMSESARLYYKSFDHQRSNVKIVQADGGIYTLLEANIDAFLTAYYTKLKDETKPPI